MAPGNAQPISSVPTPTHREAGKSARIIFRRVTQNGESMMIYRTGVSLASCLVSEPDPMRPPGHNESLCHPTFQIYYEFHTM